jgi:hypothetical protein
MQEWDWDTAEILEVFSMEEKAIDYVKELPHINLSKYVIYKKEVQ